MYVLCSFKSLNTETYIQSRVKVASLQELDRYVKGMDDKGYKNIGVWPSDKETYKSWLDNENESIPEAT